MTSNATVASKTHINDNNIYNLEYISMNILKNNPFTWAFMFILI